MTSRQRALTAFARQTPDRVPVNYFANTEIDHALKAHFGLAKTDTEGLLLRLGSDFRWIGPRFDGPALHPPIPGREVDCWGIRRVWVEHSAGGYFDYCDWPLQNATLEEVEAWPMPSPDHYRVDHIAEQCRKQSDYCILAGSPGEGDIINSTGMLRTQEQALVDLITADPAGLRLVDRRHAVQLAVLERVLDAAKKSGRGVDVLWLGEDLGTQIGPIISLELFRKQIRPRMQKFVDLGRAYNLPVMVHSCGSSSWAFDDFIDMGISIVDTLQPEAANMSPAYLKARYGSKLAFHGCISTAGALAYGTVADVVKNVRETLDIMKPGGGYALAPTHSIQSNSPVENVLAMYETARG